MALENTNNMSNAGAVSAKSKATTGANVAVMVIVAVTITIVINYLAAQSRFQTFADWTSSASNTLSDKTIGILKGLPNKLGNDADGRERVIEFVSFLRPRYSEIDVKAIQMVHQMVDVYKSHGAGRIAFSTFDVNRELNAVVAKLQELKIKEPSEALLIALGDRVRTLYLEDMVKIDRPRGGMMGGGEEGERISDNNIEESITSNLLALLEAEKPKAYFITGHGEADLDSNDRDGLGRFAVTLRQSGYDVASLDLTEKGGVPSDAKLVVWIAATRQAQPAELASLKNYAHNGGRFIVALDPTIEANADAGMLTLLAEFAIKAPPGVVCQPIPDPLTGGPAYGLPECAEITGVRSLDFSSAHPVTKSFFEQKVNLPFPRARALERILEGDSKAMVEDLGRTHRLSWVDLPPFDFTPDKDKESAGAKTVIAAATLPNDSDKATSAPADVNDKKTREGRIIVIGSATLARNMGFDVGRDLYLSAAEWLAGREFAAGIGPKKVQKNPLADNTQIRPRVIGLTLILSGLAMAAAGYVWYTRRGVFIALLAGLGAGAFPFLLGVYNLLMTSLASGQN